MKAERGIDFDFTFPVSVMDFFVGNGFQPRKVALADEGPENFPSFTKGNLQKAGA